ncbi:hypothetical protein ACFYUV_44555 [Nonomuraea sp. NPDC003560]|uniref:hypothetical protein n=1 Tax=Nonomuraea sp. NPDC003560 TaxID=3364341 RepID=UPI00368F3A17
MGEQREPGQEDRVEDQPRQQDADGVPVGQASDDVVADHGGRAVRDQQQRDGSGGEADELHRGVDGQAAEAVAVAPVLRLGPQDPGEQRADALDRRQLLVVEDAQLVGGGGVHVAGQGALEQLALVGEGVVSAAAVEASSDLGLAIRARYRFCVDWCNTSGAPAVVPRVKAAR